MPSSAILSTASVSSTLVPSSSSKLNPRPRRILRIHRAWHDHLAVLLGIHPKTSKRILVLPMDGDDEALNQLVDRLGTVAQGDGTACPSTGRARSQGGASREQDHGHGGNRRANERTHAEYLLSCCRS